METINVPKRRWNTIDELVALMKESKRQSKIESEERYKSKEVQAIYAELRIKNKKLQNV